jgi:heme A synthase
LLLVGLGWYFARRLSQKGSAVMRAANFTVIAIVLEALLGAGLVLLKLVEFDQSIARAFSISAHLVNTLFLVGSLVTLTFLSRDQTAYETSTRALFPKDPFFRLALGIFLILGISGAIAALGDTLFKVSTLSEGFHQELSTNAHFLIRLRVFHPVLACLWVFLGFLWSQKLLSHESFQSIQSLRNVRTAFLGALILQFSIGFLNWVLLAPVFLQLIHLLVADLVFISFWISGLSWSTLKHETRESRLSA